MFKHQLEGVKFLLARHGALLADEMGLGKTRQAVAAAYQLFQAGSINQILVLCPAGVVVAWEQELEKLSGELALTFSRYQPGRPIPDPRDRTLHVLAVSYDTAWREPHYTRLARWCEVKNTVLICDESSFLKSRTAKRTRRAQKLATYCTFHWLLTGTPVTNSPLDLWSQLQIADSKIFQRFNNFYHFRARYARLGGFQMRQVIGYENLDELRQLVAPHALRREKKDCLDLPEKLYTTREVALDPATWKMYKELRDEAVAELSEAETRLEPNAGVRLLRLAQLTSGILGGQAPARSPAVGNLELFTRELPPLDLSNEKLRWAVEHLTDSERPRAVIVWCRWRRERERLHIKLADKKITIFQIYGGQPKSLREEAAKAFSGVSAVSQNMVLLAQPHAGGFGLNLTAAAEAVYLSHDFSLETRLQSEDRCHRIGQRNPVTYVDVLATGPAGQRTIDHVIVRALRKKQDLAAWTCAAWKRALTEEVF